MSIIFILTSCTLIGGNCNYQKTVGTGIVKSIEKNSCIVDFYPNEKVSKNIYAIEGKCIGDVLVGERYEAVYKKARHGSCAPYFLRVYHGDVNIDIMSMSGSDKFLKGVLVK